MKAVAAVAVEKVVVVNAAAEEMAVDAAVVQDATELAAIAVMELDAAVVGDSIMLEDAEQVQVNSNLHVLGVMELEL